MRPVFPPAQPVSREQYRINDSRQLLSPQQLVEGMHIGVVTIGLMRVNPSIAKFTAAMARLLRHPDETSPHGPIDPWYLCDGPSEYVLIPQWQGVIDQVLDHEVKATRLNRVRHDQIFPTAEYDTPVTRIYASFSAMGLAPLVSKPEYRPVHSWGKQSSRVDGWLAIATLNLSEPTP